jgi:cell division initiation protein
MIDLTPLDVRKKRGDFRRILRGYDPEEVDTFMDLVAERFEELVRENLSLGEKTEQMSRQLTALEGRERAVQEALVTAQKLREEVGDQSRRDAEVLQEQASRMVEVLKAEAETEIQRRLSEAEGLIRERQRALEDLERSRLKFLKSFRGLLEREIDAVDVEESRRPLEETPLELEFRGWMPSGDLEFGIGEGEFPEDEAEIEEASPVLEAAPVVEEGLGKGEDEVPALKAGVGQEEAEADEPAAKEEVDEDSATPEADLEIPEAAEAPAVEAPAVEAPAAEAPAVETPAFETDETEGQEAKEEPQDPWAAAADFPTAELEEAEESEDFPTGFETQILEGAAPASLDPIPEAEADAAAEDDGGAEEDPGAIPQEPRWLFSLLKKDEQTGEEV